MFLTTKILVLNLLNTDDGLPYKEKKFLIMDEAHLLGADAE